MGDTCDVRVAEASEPAEPATAMSGRARVVAAVVATALLAAGAVAYTVRAAGDARAGDQGQVTAAHELRLDRSGQLFYRDAAAGGRLAAAPLGEPTMTLTVAKQACERFYAAAGTGVCLTPQSGLLRRSDAVILDSTLREVRRVPLSGAPNRARVSASGRMVSWTVFVTGDSYARSGFSTWTSILDTRSGDYVANIESIPVYRGGVRYYAPDINFWGVTFASDDNRFYATMASAGKTYLVQGDVDEWQVRTLRENVECPSLSPDNTRVVFKKKVSADPHRPWRLYVLELATGREKPLAETASVDDQAAWLDDRTVAYARPGAAPGSSDVWAVAADGSGRPRLLVRGGSSPSAVR